jgi:phosphotransferase system HPr-like phosphotransfer protein
MQRLPTPTGLIRRIMKLVKVDVVAKEDIHSLVASHIVKELNTFSGEYALRLGRFNGVDLKSILGLISLAMKAGTHGHMIMKDTKKGIIDVKALLEPYFLFGEIEVLAEEI